MDSNNNSEEGWLRKLLSRLWSFWLCLIFAPEPEPLIEPPDPKAPESEHENYKQLIGQRKAFHGETSKTIRRVFYALVGTCLFCVITLAGSHDIQLLTPDATVKLPILNYEMGFQPFLVVAPVILIALTIYLHIFVGQHRLLKLASEGRQPMLPNFNSWTAKIVVLVIFYWITPVTLATFAWKAWPHPYGISLHNLAIGVAVVLVFLQIRRCPREWRLWGIPSLVGVFYVFSTLVLSVETDRHLNLFKADLSKKDLRNKNLSYADLKEANLTEANLTGANLTGANLTGANLNEADLIGADLSGANLNEANLNEANLNEANLIGADLSGAKNVVQGQLDKSCGKKYTKLPEGLTIKPCPKTDDGLLEYRMIQIRRPLLLLFR